MLSENQNCISKVHDSKNWIEKELTLENRKDNSFLKRVIKQNKKLLHSKVIVSLKENTFGIPKNKFIYFH